MHAQLTHALTVTLAHSRPHCHWGSLPRLPAASLAGAFFPRRCFRLILSVSTAVRLLTQECGQCSGTLFYKAKQCIWDVKCRLLLVWWEKTNGACVCSCVRVCWICFWVIICDILVIFTFGDVFDQTDRVQIMALSRSSTPAYVFQRNYKK